MLYRTIENSLEHVTLRRTRRGRQAAAPAVGPKDNHRTTDWLCFW